MSKATPKEQPYSFDEAADQKQESKGIKLENIKSTQKFLRSE